MSTRSRFWVWFCESRRWVDATAAGAEHCFVAYGCEVAWGVRPPESEGFMPSAYLPFLRPMMWKQFALLVAAHPDRQSRTGSYVTASN